MGKLLFAAAAIAALAAAGLAIAEEGGQRGRHRLFEAADSNSDGVLTRQEFDAGREAMFARLDADHDGQLSRGDRRRHRGDGERGGRHDDHQRNADANNDGAITREEFLARPLQMFARLDSDSDGVISADERSRRRIDADGDHRVSNTEFAARGTSLFERLDADHDGRVTREEAARGHHGRRE